MKESWKVRPPAGAASALALIAGALLAGCPPDPLGLPADPPPTEVRPATYNTAHFGDVDAGHPDGDKAGEVVGDIVRIQNTLGIDLWLFQEVYRTLAPNPNPFVTDQLALILAGLGNFDAVFFQENDADGEFSKGNVVAWDATQYVPIGPQIGLLWQSGSIFSDQKGCTGQILERIADGKQLLVASAHFDAGPDAPARELQAVEAVQRLTAEVAARAGFLNVPPGSLKWVFGGDLNTAFGVSEGAYAQLVGAGLTPSIDFDVSTFNLGFHLDHVFSKGLPLLGADVDYDAEGSDHFPVIASFDMP